MNLAGAAAPSAPDLQGRALAAGLLLVLVWGTNFSIQKLAYQALTPGGFLFCRSLVMAALAAALLWLRHRRIWPRMDAEQWRRLLRVTVVGQVLHIGLITFGIHWSTAFSSALIFACGPVVTLLLLRWLGQARLQRHQVGGVLLALAGVLLFMAEKLLGADWRASGGDAMMLAGVLLFSLYTIWATPLVARHGGLEVMCWTTLLASPLMLAVSAPAALAAPWASASPAAWAAFFWTVVVAAFMGWMAWGWINSVRGVARTAPLLYLVPPVAGTVAWLIAGERFGWQKLLGAALALAGVAWAQWRRAQVVPC